MTGTGADRLAARQERAAEAAMKNRVISAFGRVTPETIALIQSLRITRRGGRMITPDEKTRFSLAALADLAGGGR